MRLALATLLLACAAQAQEPLFVTPDPQSTQPRFFSAFDGHVYFLADAVPDPSQLQGTWRTDGTAAGTEYLFGLNWLGKTTVLDGDLYFFALDTPENGGTGPTDLFRLDGTAATRLTAFSTGNLVSAPVAVGGRIFFAGTPSSSGFDVELYAFTPGSGGAGTLQRFDLNPSASGRSSSPQFFTVIGDTLFFAVDFEDSATPQSDRRILRFDPGAVAPTTVAPSPAGEPINALAALGPTLFARGGDGGLYRLDGDTLVPVGDFAGVRGLTPFDGHLYFGADARADTPDVGFELWRTDGTTVELVADIGQFPGAEGIDSNPGGLYVHGGQLYFSAKSIAEGDSRLRAGLWRTDGTTTERVPGIAPLDGPGIDTDFPHFVSLGDDLAVRCSVPSLGSTICLVDGTTGDVRAIEADEVRDDLAAAGDRLVYSAFTSSVGYDVHVVDPAEDEPVSTVPVPIPAGGNAGFLRFYRSVGLQLLAGDDLGGTGTVTAARHAGAPADATGLPTGTPVPCRWEVTESGGVTFDSSDASVRISPVSQAACYGDDPAAATLYYRPTVGAGAFTALTTDAAGYASSRRPLVYEGAVGFGEYALVAPGGFTAAEAAPGARPALRLVGPNPARDVVRLAAEAAPGEHVRVAVVDALGRQVMVTESGPDGAIRLDTSRLAPGVYVARRDGGRGVAFSVVR